MTAPLGHHCHRVEFTLGRRFTSDFCPSNADRGDRRANHHFIRVVGRDLAGNKHEHALDHRKAGRAFERRRIENQLVQHHPAVLAERELRLVDEDDRHRRPGAGVQNVALVDGRVLGQRHRGAIDPARRDRAHHLIYTANGLRLDPTLSLGILPRRGGAGEQRDQVGRQHGTACRHQRRRLGEGKIVLDQNPIAVRADQEQIRPFSHELGNKQHRVVGNDQLAARDGF